MGAGIRGVEGRVGLGKEMGAGIRGVEGRMEWEFMALRA